MVHGGFVVCTVELRYDWAQYSQAYAQDIIANLLELNMVWEVSTVDFCITQQC